MSNSLRLNGCTSQPLAAYLKALGILRLVSEQSDEEARGSWSATSFVLESRFDREGLIDFFLNHYKPTSVLAPWNGGSGFYPKDRTVGIDAIANSAGDRFATYRQAIVTARSIVEKRAQKASAKADEDARRAAILRDCRNQLPDECVDWLDAAIAIASDESRAFAPILGTGGNEGRLDYTNNFMENLANLLGLTRKIPARALLENALFDDPAEGLQDISVGQYDPGRAGGFNQGQGISSASLANPWTVILTVEGAVAWASGIYRKQGVSYRSFLCSPFTVRPSAVGYGSACDKDERTARAEIWTPIWTQPARYAEIRSLLREARANVNDKPAANGFDFARAVASLGVDRSISSFVRYSVLKRRGDSYVAAPIGSFPVHYRRNEDLIRQLDDAVDAAERSARAATVELPNSWPPLKRAVQEAAFQALLREGPDTLLHAASAFGAMKRWLFDRGISSQPALAPDWVSECAKTSSGTEVRIAAALRFLQNAEAGPLSNNLARGGDQFAWMGRDLPERMLNTLRRRVLSGGDSGRGPLWSRMYARAADVARFIDGGTQDDLIEDLLFAFCGVNDRPQDLNGIEDGPDPWASYTLLKQMFLSSALTDQDGTPIAIKPDLAIPSLLTANRVTDAVAIAIRRLRIAGVNPIDTKYQGTSDSRRLGAALLIPISKSEAFRLLRTVAEPLNKTDKERTE